MPELRHDPIQKRWVIIVTERDRRPNDFENTHATKDSLVFDPFQPGNEEHTPAEIMAIRDKNSKANEPGWSVRVVPNKFPALKIEGELEREGMGLYDKMNGVGAHEVIIETPELSETIDKMADKQLINMLTIYRDRLNDLKRDARFRYILIFKNHGAQAGATLAHPHSQIIATPVTPKAVANELASAKDYYFVKERCLFCDLMKQELLDKERIVIQNEHFVVYCPYASRFPFEMMLLPRKHSHDFGSMDEGLVSALAKTLKQAMKKLTIALEDPPFNLMVHTAPNITGRSRRPTYWDTLEDDWHWHIEITPRMTNLAGFEWGTDFYINHVSPEEAAKHLRQVELD